MRLMWPLWTWKKCATDAGQLLPVRRHYNDQSARISQASAHLALPGNRGKGLVLAHHLDGGIVLSELKVRAVDVRELNEALMSPPAA